MKTSSTTEFPIVGVGASAGGLEALQRLFEGMPADCQMAFVIIQHLSPDFKSMMDEILSKHTSLQVQRAQNDMAVEPGTIYLLPSNTEMIIASGRLLLTEREQGKGLFLPIDVFFRSLAEDVGSRSIGIVLSGTGSDGSRGIKAIHAAGGIVMAQSEVSAKFTGMPRSAIDSGVVDYVGEPPELRAELLRLTSHADAPLDGAVDLESTTLPIFTLLRRETGLDFTRYKTGSIGRRLDRRFRISRVSSLAEYLDLLQGNPDELKALYRDLLIGVTSFFRDKDAFDVLTTKIFPGQIAALDDEELRVWTAGCATGEEAYSLSIALHEAFRTARKPPRVKIFATDVHKASLEIASSGVYPSSSVAEVPQELRGRYFTTIEDRVQVSRELRSSVVFAPHDLLRDVPFTRLDLVTCRNLLIYIKPSAQRRILSLLHFALKTGGVLFMGPSESPGAMMDEFETVDRKWKIYRKRRDIRLPSDVRELNAPTRHGPRAADKTTDTQRQAMEVLVSSYAPPSLLVNPNLALIHSFNGGGRYLAQRDGAASLNILDMVEGELKLALAGAIRRVLSNRERVEYAAVHLPTADREVTVTAYPVGSDVLVAIEQVTSPVRVQDIPKDADMDALALDRVESLEQELNITRENLQATMEEMEASNEELQATNEELIASNEELQSTNEELQSVNEELYTVNAEHQSKIAELTELASDMDHLLSATHVHTMFLDADLRIRKFTPEIARTFNLIPRDVGRPIEGFTHRLDNPDLVDELRSVLADGKPIERDIQDTEGRWLLQRVMPYQPEDTVTGIVLTLIDVDTIKRAELRYRKLIEVSGVIVWTVNPAGLLHGAQPAVEHYTGLDAAALRGRAIYDIVHDADRDRVKAAWEAASARGDGFTVGCRVWSQAHEAYHRVAMHASPLRDPVVGGDIPGWLGSFHDVESHLSAEERADALDARLRGILDHSPSPIFLKDREGRYQFASPIVGHIFGTQEFHGKTDIELLPAETAAALREHDRQVMETREPVEVEEHLPTPWGDRTYLTCKFPVFDGDGEIAAVAGVATDVTAQKQQEVRDRNAIAQRDTFIAMMSHELRTPLSAIVNASYALQLPANTQGDVDSAVQIIDRQARHLTRLVDDLLDVARIERGLLHVGQATVDLAEIVRGAVAGARAQMEAADITLALDCPDTRPLWIRGDAVRLEQVFANLLNNALRFSEADGTVTVAVSTRGGSAYVRVTDTGMGMSPDECERVFELFYQREQSLERRQGGLGLGLALASQLVASHGGTITAHSDGPGKGSEFTVELPLDTTAVAVPVTDEGSSLPKLSRATIVIVEDGEDSRVLLTMLLERLGHHVIPAATGEEGVDAIIEHRPSLALVDIGLPGIDGYEVARRVRADNDGVTYLVALTGYGMPSDRDRALDAGFDEHLVKPLRPEVLRRLAQSRSR